MPKLSSIAASLCAAHCLLMPILVVLLPNLGFLFQETPWWEVGEKLLIYALATLAATKALLGKDKGQKELFAIGALLFTLSLLWPSHWTLLGGSLVLILGNWWTHHSEKNHCHACQLHPLQENDHGEHPPSPTTDLQKEERTEDG